VQALAGAEAVPCYRADLGGRLEEVKQLLVASHSATAFSHSAIAFSHRRR